MITWLKWVAMQHVLLSYFKIPDADIAHYATHFKNHILPDANGLWASDFQMLKCEWSQISF